MRLTLCALATLPVAPAAAAPGWFGAEQHGPTVISNSGPDSAQYIGPLAAIGGGGHAVVAWDRSSNTPAGECCLSRIELVERAPGGASGEVRTLPGAAGLHDDLREVAVGANGAAAIVLGTRPAIDAEVEEGRVALRSPSGAWGDPVTLVPNATPTLAIADDGSTTALWVDGPRIVTSTSRGAGWSAPEAGITMTDDQRILEYELAGDGGGGLVLGMTVQDVSIEYVPYPDSAPEPASAVFVATRPPGGAWSSPERVGPWSYASTGEVEVNRRGDAAVTWTGEDGGLHLLRRPAGGPFAPDETVGGEGWHDARFSASLALGEDGHVTVIREGFSSDPFRGWVEVLDGPIGGPLSGPERVGLDEQRLDDPSVAPLAGGGALLVGYGDGPDEDDSIDFMRTFVRPPGGGSFAETPHPLGFARSLVVAGNGAGGALVGWSTFDMQGSEDVASSVHSVRYGEAEEGAEGEADSSDGEEGGGSDGGGPLVPVRVTDRIRMRLRGGLKADRRGIVRLRMSFDERVRGLVRVSDVLGRTLAERRISARRGVPLRVRLHVSRRVIRKLRHGRITVRLSLRLTTATGRTVRAAGTTRLRGVRLG